MLRQTECGDMINKKEKYINLWEVSRMTNSCACGIIKKTTEGEASMKKLSFAVMGMGNRGTAYAAKALKPG